ncbi:hypothetical protein [Cellulomonas sp. P24]|uniref:hypothetical protein n=1 Tax=Cellulomonas sp. P24 TaxID=2885206 RepID=UPI00216B0326|nr:hypothetical protein [Cellulomonas sp. P24]MCR6492717.1 hypothetical protein [Cellulomonas sp. P24]
MAALTAAPTLVTLSDVAALAHVQRPVASMWRTRSAGSAHPFPAAAQRRNGRDAFLLEDVVAWLEATGHGNNPAVRQESAAATALDLLPDAGRLAAVDGLLALLVLKAQLDTPLSGLGAQDLVDLADDVDPHDRSLHREIVALGADAPVWARHADALASAAFTPAEAVNALVKSHRRLGLEDISSYSLDAAALTLLAGLAVELTPTGADARTFVSPDGDAELLTAVAALREEPGTAALPPFGDSASRRARRTLLANGWDLIDASENDGLVSPPEGSTVLVHLPSATRPKLTDTQIVDALSALEATLPADARAIVVGPAGALCGRLPRALQSARATVLRSGRVRAIVRLPAGLWPAHPRQGLGVWILGPRTGDVRSADHRTAVADLRATPLDTAAINDLVTDLVAAADSSLDPLAHAFRFTRFATTTTLIATSADLVTSHTATRRPRTDPATLTLEINALYGNAAATLPGLDFPVLRPGEASGPTAIALGRLIELGHLRLVRGNRLFDADLTTGNGVRVHTPLTVTGLAAPGTEPTIDRLTFAATYPRGRYTQPGDIVFCTAPHPAAVVDRDGFAVVATPARALRLTSTAPPGLIPEIIAQAIATSSRLGGWRLWPIPLVPTSQANAVRSALTDLADARTATAARLVALDALTTRLVDAVTSGSVTLIDTDRPAQMEG